MRATLIVLMLVSLMLVSLASVAPAQIRLFKDGQIIKLGPTKAEQRARQRGMMLGVMSGRHPMPDANRPRGGTPPAQDQGAAASR